MGRIENLGGFRFNSKMSYVCLRVESGDVDDKIKNEIKDKIKELNNKINAYEKRKEANAEVNKTLFGAFSAALLGSLLFPLAPLVSTISVVAMPIIFFLGAFLGVVSGVQNIIEKDEIIKMENSIIGKIKEFNDKNGKEIFYIQEASLRKEKSWFQQLIN